MLPLTVDLVIKPYRLERDHFLDTTCRVTRHTEHGFHPCTYSCGRYCTRDSKFLCVAITVEIRDKDNRTKESVLFLHRRGKQRTCSIYECGASVRKTTETVRKRLQQWPIGRQAPCVYNRLDHTQTKEKRKLSPIQAFNALFWPLWASIAGMVGLVGGGGLFIYFFIDSVSLQRTLGIAVLPWPAQQRFHLLT